MLNPVLHWLSGFIGYAHLIAFLHLFSIRMTLKVRDKDEVYA